MYFEELQETKNTTENNVIIMGDMNSSVGDKIPPWKNGSERKGEEVRNDNGISIINMCIPVGSTKFTHRDEHKYTREERTSVERSVTFLINSGIWKSIKNINVKSTTEIESYDYFVKMKQKIERDTIKEKIRTH